MQRLSVTCPLRTGNVSFLALLPELRQEAIYPPPCVRDAARDAVERVRATVMQALDGQLLSVHEPFLGELTLGQYLDLPDTERARLWNVRTTVSLEEIEERDVSPEAIPAR